jgi:uncharacterized protein (DUF58 family)
VNSIRSSLRRGSIPLPLSSVRVTVRHWAVFVVWLIVTAFAYQTGRDLFFRLFYLLLAVLGFSFFWGAYAVLTFEFERRLITPHTYAGRLAEERFLVHNTGRFSKIWMEVRDESELPYHRASRVLNSLRAHSHWTWSVRTQCRQRGRFRLGPATISTGDPFGIFVFHRRIPDSTESIVVYPATIDLPNFSPPVGALSGGDAMQRRTHHVTTNVAGTREYVPGDSFNRIHWRSSARAERLIVKEFELDPTSDVWIFLDMERDVQSSPWWVEDSKTRQTERQDASDLSALWFGDQGPRVESSTEEYCVSIAASVAKYYLGRQRAVGFVAYGHQREIVQPDRGERQLTRLLEALAVLRAEGRTPFGQVLAVEGARLGRNTSLVVVTPSVELQWVRFVREVKRRGMHTIAVLADLSSFGAHGDARVVAVELQSGGIPTYIVRAGDDLGTVLGRAL